MVLAVLTSAVATVFLTRLWRVRLGVGAFLAGRTRFTGACTAFFTRLWPVLRSILRSANECRGSCQLLTSLR